MDSLPVNPVDKKRWALELEFDGTDYVGWQRQETGPSVQQALEEAACRLARIPAVSTVTSGRTDSGVHAVGMIVHLDLPADLKVTQISLPLALNHFLQPQPISVLRAREMPITWNARFSALSRRYRYVILQRPARPALGAQYVWHHSAPLDLPAMQEAARHLHGTHDFSTFRAYACQARSPVKTLDEITLWREGEHIYMEIQARSFLHHQVRNIMGTLALVGRGKWSLKKFQAAFQARDRTAGGPTAPASGLFLMKVAYREPVF